MGQFLLILVGALGVGVIVFGVTVLVSGDDPGLVDVEPDGSAVPLPTTRPLAEEDVAAVRFDTAVRGYRMAQVDAALRRAGYDIGYKTELIQVLEAEVDALRDGRVEEADALRATREASLAGAVDSGDADAGATDFGDADSGEAGDAAADRSESAAFSLDKTVKPEVPGQTADSGGPHDPESKPGPDGHVASGAVPETPAWEAAPVWQPTSEWQPTQQQ